VMLYGITALLFNHPGAFPDHPQRILSGEDFAGTALARMADAPADAARVVAALNAKSSSRGMSGSPYRLVEPDRAAYTRDVVVARARGEGQEHSVLLDLASGTAVVGTAEQPDAQRAPFAVRGLKVPGSLGERVKAGLPKALARQGLAADDAGVSIGPELLFFVEADGRVWRGVYNTQTGAVSGRPADAGSRLSTRQFLTELHLAHGYASNGGSRWIWALAVDAMFASMVFWGVSGLLMWWQIKRVRVIGAVLMTGTLIGAACLALGMHRVLGAF
jgi:hypothetical protein